MKGKYLTREELERRRLQGAALLKQGINQSEAARRLGVSRVTTHRWARILAKEGTHALRRRRPPGRRCRLTPEQLDRVCELWKTREHWTTATFAQAIECEFGVRYHEDHTGRLMHKLGLRPKRERAKAAGHGD